MLDSRPEKKPDVKIIHLLPNLMTISAICAGLTAIRFGYQGDFEMAVRLILLAGILDGLDGRLARFLHSPSPVGAELDSLADFVNFGVAPVLVLHSWAFQDFQSEGWIAVLAYAICSVLRLARFNVDSRQDKSDTPGDFFVGVPAPAGAVLVMLPMYVSFLFSDMPLAPPAVIAAYIFVIGLLMISRLPTYSFKNISVDRGNAKFLLLGAVLTTAALLTYLWASLVLLTLAYIGALIFGALSTRRRPRI